MVDSIGPVWTPRGYGTLLNNEGGSFCGSNKGCVVSIKGQAFCQGEGLIGLSLRF